MAQTLYTLDILRLAADLPHAGPLAAPDATAERRSAICGSRVAVDVALGTDGRVADLGLVVHACALGQASAALLGAHAIGRDAAQLTAVRDALTAWLAGEGEMPEWPGMAVLAPALPHTARHPAIRLAFEAAADAVATAARGRRTAA